MNFFEAIVLGIVEGVSEFLPISSTGHLIAVSHFLGLPQTEFLKSFEIAIQLGAISAVLFLYGKSYLFEWEVIKKVFVAFIPTAIIGLIFYKIVKSFLLGSIATVAWALFLGGIFLILFEKFHKEKQELDISPMKISSISYRNAFIIGLFQSIAIIPGISRAAATIVGGLILGLSRRTIIEFSFLLAAPTMLAATVLDLAKNASFFSSSQLEVLLVGFFVAGIVAFGSIKFLLQFIKSHSFVSFGIYRICAAIIFYLLLL